MIINMFYPVKRPIKRRILFVKMNLVSPHLLTTGFLKTKRVYVFRISKDARSVFLGESGD